jgi:hypothetical protein
LGESEFPASLPALLMMVCLAIAGAYQSSQGNSSENDPNNTTVSGLFFSKKENWEFSLPYLSLFCNRSLWVG